MVVRRFVQAEDGAVTVDWVVLTAAIVGIAIAVLAVIANGLNTASTDIKDEASSGWSEIASNISGTSGISLASGYIHTGFRETSTGAVIGFNPNDGTYSVGSETGITNDEINSRFGDSGSYENDPNYECVEGDLCFQG